MSKEEEEQSSNTCWICEIHIDDDDEKVIFQNLRGYDSHWIICTVGQ